MNNAEVMEHACARAKERYGLPLSEAEYRALCNQVSAGMARRIGQLGDGKGIYTVMYRHLTLRAVWGSVSRQIVTFLPRGQFK